MTKHKKSVLAYLLPAIALLVVIHYFYSSIPRFPDTDYIRHTSSSNISITITLENVTMNIPAKSHRVVFFKTNDPKTVNDVCMSKKYEQFWFKRNEHWKQFIGKNTNNYIKILYKNVPEHLKQLNCTIDIDEKNLQEHTFRLYCPILQEMDTLPIIKKDTIEWMKYELFLKQLRQYDNDIKNFSPPIISHFPDEETYC